LAGIRFGIVPEGVPAGTVTGTEIVHVPRAVGLPAGMTPPFRVTLELVVVTVVTGGVPQVVVAVPATINGLCKLSVTCTPV
jgi:hypothetical protein